MDTNSKLSNNTAVVLISHGSTLPYAEETFKQIKNKFIKKTNIPTEIGYMKVSHPTISEAINILKTQNPNIEKIIALPVFLAPGIHTNIDIPILLGLKPLETDPRCPDGNYPSEHYLSIADEVDFNGEIQLLPAIGPVDELIDIINKRITQSLKESSENKKTGAVLVSHGSRLNYNKEFTTQLHDKFKKTTKYPSEFGFMELCEPSIPQAINKLTKENKIDRLIVIPIFIAPGMHTTHDIPHILGLTNHTHQHTHDHEHDLTPIEFDGEVLYPDPIGADDILIDILADKIN